MILVIVDYQMLGLQSCSYKMYHIILLYFGNYADVMGGTWARALGVRALGDFLL